MGGRPNWPLRKPTEAVAHAGRAAPLPSSKAHHHQLTGCWATRIGGRTSFCGRDPKSKQPIPCANAPTTSRTSAAVVESRCELTSRGRLYPLHGHTHSLTHTHTHRVPQDPWKETRASTRGDAAQKRASERAGGRAGGTNGRMDGSTEGTVIGGDLMESGRKETKETAYILSPSMDAISPRCLPRLPGSSERWDPLGKEARSASPFPLPPSKREEDGGHHRCYLSTG